MTSIFAQKQFFSSLTKFFLKFQNLAQFVRLGSKFLCVSSILPVRDRVKKCPAKDYIIWEKLQLVTTTTPVPWIVWLKSNFPASHLELAWV